MRVLITGATGFLGQWVARSFVAAGHLPRLLVRKPPECQLTAMSVELAHGDILESATLAQAMRAVDAVVHVAGLVSLRASDAPQLERVNVSGTENVLREAARRDLPVVHTSSIATLGYTDGPEPQDETCFMPQSQARGFAYAGSKLRAEQLALAAAKHGQHVICLNPGLLFGPGDPYFSSTRPVLEFVSRKLPYCLTGGISVADVRDVAAVYPTALARAPRGQRLLLGGTNLAYTQLFEQLGRIAGLPAAFAVPRSFARGFALWSDLATSLGPHPFEELNSTSVTYGSLYNYSDSSLATELLGYRPRPLEQTLRDTVFDHLVRGAARASTPQLQQLLQQRSGEQRRAG